MRRLKICKQLTITILNSPHTFQNNFRIIIDIYLLKNFLHVRGLSEELAGSD